MKRIVLGVSNNVRIRALNNTNAPIIGMASATKGLDLIRVTSKLNGFAWYVVMIDGKEGYIREDVAKIIEVKKESSKVKGNKIQLLCIHCTATPEGRDVTKEQIVRWHTAPKSHGGRGWSRVGYSRLINLQGDLILMHEYNENDIIEPWEVTNGASGINSKTRHIVYAGGCDKNMKAKDTRNENQKETLKEYVLDCVKKYPDIKVCGHYHFANKACPSFDVEKWCEEIGLNEKNIFKK